MKTNGMSHLVYQTAPFPMTLSNSVALKVTSEFRRMKPLQIQYATLP